MDKPVIARREDFYGWHPGLDVLLGAYADQAAPHALLLSGPQGLLKEHLALFLAQSFLCASPDRRPCGDCGVCRRVLSGSYGNLLKLGLEKKEKSIKIDQLRRVLDQLALNPLERGARFVLVIDADLLTPQAQNALLKSLEEPDQGSYFILTTANEQAVLPTVLSRCLVQRLLPWPLERSARFLIEQGIDEKEALALAEAASGYPGRALALREDPRREALARLMEESFLSVRALKDIPRISFMLKDIREEAGHLLDLLEQQAQRALSARMLGKPLPPALKDAGASALKTLIEDIYTARRYLASNVSWQAVADRLLFTIAKEIHQCQWS